MATEDSWHTVEPNLSSRYIPPAGGVAFPFLSPLLDAMVLKEVTPLSDSLAIYGAPQDQLSEQKKELVEFVDAFITLTYD